MPSFFALNIAVSGLRASQYAMDITAHNIANAGTQGYHRQEAVFLPGLSISSGLSMANNGIPTLGTGVQVESIRRAQTNYIDQQVRMGNQWLGQWSYKSNALTQIETFLAEPGNQGLSTSLNNFWNSWSNLATSPESDTARADVVAKGMELCQKFTYLNTNLRGIQSTADDNICDEVAQINSLAQDITHLNMEIRRSLGAGGTPNDLLDRRDLLLDQLSTLTQIETSGADKGDLIVSISGRALVQGDIANTLTVADGPTGWSIPVWSDDGSAVDINGGELAAQIATRDVMTEGYLQSLNNIAQSVVERVNAIHSTGVTRNGDPAGDFFVPGTDSSTIAVNPALIASPNNVATSTTSASGGHDVADAIAKLMTEPGPDGVSVNNAYAALVARIGSDSREAGIRVETHSASLDQLETQRQSSAGVSMDEEMANMVKFQQSYNAAARIFTVIDEMMDTVVNRMGMR